MYGVLLPLPQVAVMAWSLIEQGTQLDLFVTKIVMNLTCQH